MLSFSQSKQRGFVLKFVEMSSENRDIMPIIYNRQNKMDNVYLDKKN